MPCFLRLQHSHLVYQKLNLLAPGRKESNVFSSPALIHSRVTLASPTLARWPSQCPSTIQSQGQQASLHLHSAHTCTCAPMTAGLLCHLPLNDHVRTNNCAPSPSAALTLTAILLLIILEPDRGRTPCREWRERYFSQEGKTWHATRQMAHTCMAIPQAGLPLVSPDDALFSACILAEGLVDVVKKTICYNFFCYQIRAKGESQRQTVHLEWHD